MEELDKGVEGEHLLVGPDSVKMRRNRNVPFCSFQSFLLNCAIDMRRQQLIGGRAQSETLLAPGEALRV